MGSFLRALFGEEPKSQDWLESRPTAQTAQDPALVAANQRCHEISQDYATRRRTCPHCDQVTKVRYTDGRSTGRASYFTCGDCQRTFYLHEVEQHSRVVVARTPAPPERAGGAEPVGRRRRRRASQSRVASRKWNNAWFSCSYSSSSSQNCSRLIHCAQLEPALLDDA